MPLIEDAGIILGMVQSKPDSKQFIIHGRDILDQLPGDAVPPGYRVLVVRMDPENTKTRELDKFHAIVHWAKTP